MDANEAEHYVAFALDGVHEGIQNNVSHEEICEPVDDYVLPDVTEETETEVNHQDAGETPPTDANSVTATVDDNADVEEIVEEEEAMEEDEDQQQQREMEEDEEEGDAEQQQQSTYIYIKQEATHQNQQQQQQFSSGDESMAVEALRQLGGMYCYEEARQACPNCSETFPPSELAKHQSACSSGKLTCTVCSDKFERKTDLNNHMVCHQVDRPHACRTCGNLFKSKANLQAHMVEVHQVERPHKCSVCGANFQRPSSLSNHMKIHNYVAGRALVQGNNSVVANVETVKEVEDQSAQGATSTVLTTVQAIQNLELPDGQWTAVQITTDQGNIEGLALQSDKMDTLQEFTVLPNGEITNVTEYAAQNDVQDANSTNKSGKKSKAGGKGHTCSICGVSFARAVSLSVHMKTHPKSELTLPVECEYCDKQFQDTNSLVNHQIACTKKLTKGSSENRGKHACSDCGKKFTTKQKMFRHQWIHRRKTFSCEICGSQFEKQPQLDAHRLSSHPAGSPFTCQECGKSFVSRQGLWEHGRTHAGSPAHFHCDLCTKTFSSRQGYLIHHRTHTGERPYGCKFCWKAFRDGGTLRKHERIHTGERPHVCPLCQKSFNQKVVLREHIRWVHAAGKNEPEAAGPPFPCPLCEIMTQDRDELCAHIVKHSDQMIAEAKAKSSSNNSNSNETSPKAKAPKILRKKAKASATEAGGKQPKAAKATSKATSKAMSKATTKAKSAKLTTITTATASTNTRQISAEEQQEALLSITELDSSAAMSQNTYFIVKDQYSDQMCIKAYTTLRDDGTEVEGPSGSINVVTIADPDDEEGDKDQQEEIVGETRVNTMHLIPFSTASGETVFIPAEKQNNTLHLISKQNENSPVLAIPNPESDENYSQDISHMVENDETVLGMPADGEENAEEEEEAVHTEHMIVEPVAAIIKQDPSVNESDSGDESEGLACGICGLDFDDKSVLMEHVKIHI